MKTIWVLMKDGEAMGWCLTKEFAMRCLAEGESIMPKEIDEDAYIRLQM